MTLRSPGFTRGEYVRVTGLQVFAYIEGMQFSFLKKGSYLLILEGLLICSGRLSNLPDTLLFNQPVAILELGCKVLAT
jgi:hypothetical protein